VKRGEAEKLITFLGTKKGGEKKRAATCVPFLTPTTTPILRRSGKGGEAGKEGGISFSYFPKRKTSLRKEKREGRFRVACRALQGRIKL